MQNPRHTALWCGGLVLASGLFSRLYGCGVPLAALCAIAGLTLGPRLAFPLAVALVGVNTLALGFSGWGWAGALLLIALAIAALPCVLPPRPWRPFAAFALAVLVYEVGLAGAAWLLGGAGAFRLGQLALGFGQNLVAFLLLLAVWVLARRTVGQAAKPARAVR